MNIHVSLTRAELVRRVGSVSVLAEFLGVSRQAIYDWPEQRPIPAGRAYEILARWPAVFGDGPFPVDPPQVAPEARAAE